MRLSQRLGKDVYYIDNNKIIKTQIIGVIKEISLDPKTGEELPPKYLYNLSHYPEEKWISGSRVFLSKEDIIKNI